MAPTVIWFKQSVARILSRSSIASPHLCIESIPSSIQRRFELLMRSSISMISNSTRLFAICGLTVYRPLLRILGRTSDVTQRWNALASVFGTTLSMDIGQFLKWRPGHPRGIRGIPRILGWCYQLAPSNPCIVSDLAHRHCGELLDVDLHNPMLLRRLWHETKAHRWPSSWPPRRHVYGENAVSCLLRFAP